jgi:hypothetical protein
MCLLLLTMACICYHKQVLQSDAFYMLSCMLILPAHTLDKMLHELQVYADTILLILPTCYLCSCYPIKKAGNLHLAWE